MILVYIIYYIIILLSGYLLIEGYLSSAKEGRRLLSLLVHFLTLCLAAAWPSVALSIAFKTEPAQVARANAEAKGISWLIDQYFQANRKWPIASSTDIEYLGNSPELLSVLSSSKRPIEVPEKGFIDPWGEPYHIVVDADGDGICRSKSFEMVTTNCIVWTLRGPPVCSWRPN